MTPGESSHSELRGVGRHEGVSPAAEPSDTSHHLLRGAYSLVANTAVTSALGMGFWVAAARLFSSVEVGRDTVLISVMIELSTVCQLNMGNGILRFLPDLGGAALEPWARCTV